MAILTVSREYGSGGREIGRAVATALDYDFVDRQDILGNIRAAGERWEEWGRGLDEHCPTTWEKYDWSFRGFGALLQSAVLNHAASDRVVIIGMGANFLLKDIPQALRIHVVGPVELRIERVMERDSIDRETARRLIEKKDGDRSCFVRSLYGKRWEDAEEYDLVLDVGSLTIEKATDQVIAALSEKERFNSRENRNLVQMRAAADAIKAGLLIDSSLHVTTLDVEYDGKLILLRGVVHSPGEHKRVADAAAKLAGKLPLQCELHYRV